MCGLAVRRHTVHVHHTVNVNILLLCGAEFQDIIVICINSVYQCLLIHMHKLHCCLNLNKTQDKVERLHGQ